MRLYTAYSLHICSAIPLPELPEDFSGSFSPEGETSISITIDPDIAHTKPLDDGASMFSEIQDDTAILFWPNVGTYRIHNGKTITIAPERDVDPATIRLFLVGPSFSILLHQRGWMTLHGSSVSIDDHGCVFLGGSGWGKSTMCAAMTAQGHTVVADDVSMIRHSDDQPLLYPAFPRLKLWPEAATALGYDVAPLPPIRPGYSKRSLSTSNFSTAPVPIRTIYVLEKGDSVTIQPLAASEALLSLVVHTYSNSVVKQYHRELVFRQYARLACTVSVKRLIRPWDLSRLGDVIDAVEADMAAAPLLV